MIDLLIIILPIILCILLARSHIFATIISSFMLFLFYSHMTVMILPRVHILLIILILFSVALFIVKKKWKKQLLNSNKALVIILAVVRFPLNIVYLGDIILRLQYWRPITNMQPDQPSLGIFVGMMLVLPLVLTIILSIALFTVYIWKIKKSNQITKQFS